MKKVISMYKLYKRLGKQILLTIIFILLALTEIKFTILYYYKMLLAVLI